MDACRLTQSSDAEIAARRDMIQQALVNATEVPLETAQRCVDVASLAEVVVRDGNPNAITDAGTAAALAEVSYPAASCTVRVNVRDIIDRPRSTTMISVVRKCVETMRECAVRVASIVEEALGL